ncbi:hypothetical protein SAMN05661091_1650 [Paenibacillus uliginis N3/975]|uniref:Uncharacterized protein n=1 Tax=Paenibacillus uliginis N3/975 TaxID=1313296 RepID=A0A1X7H357_9BACL|nr:hypothetical protein [Paenibacillus uliginis]SMF79004.1 hypothetical protein SAMN05661091_1650 [Paenibacillus uliginis N3/975]
MVESRLKSNMTMSISLISLLIAVIVMFFGDNLIGKFGAPELDLVSTKDDFRLPDKLNEIIVKNIDKQESNLIPNTIRIVTIKNNGGSPSKNLNLVIELEGSIYQYKLNSPETITKQSIESNKLLVNLPRLSKNAEVSMIFWVLDEKNAFKVSYADDNNSGYIQSVSKESKDSNILNSILLVISIASVLVLMYELLNKYVFQLRKENKESSEKLLENITSIYEEQVSKNEEELQVSKELVTNQDVKQKLHEMIRISNELTK